MSAPDGRTAVDPVAGDAIRAAGAVVLRRTGDVVEVPLVYRDRYQDWTLPKGKLDPGELACETAVREVAEETGITIRLGVPLDRVRYRTAAGPDKIVDYWVGHARSEVSRPPDAAISAVQWFPVDQAAARLTFDRDRVVLAQALAQPPTTTLIVLRHGKAVARADWSEGEATRPLTRVGERQAEQLTGILGAYGTTALHASPWQRCQRTLSPYAKLIGTEITTWPELTQAAARQDPREFRLRWRQLRDDTVRAELATVVCGHRPTLPRAFAVLGVAARPVQTAELAVLQLAASGEPVSVEWHRATG